MFEGNGMRHSQAGSRLYLSSAPLSGVESSEPGEPSHDSPRRYAGEQLLYLGISGVLHPSKSTYELVEGACPWDNGHRPYEAVSWLTQVLMLWPLVRIVLTSTQPWKYGLDHVLEELGRSLASRVLGFTYEDLTTEQTKLMRGRAGTRLIQHSDEDYWRMHKSDIVRAHVRWAQPATWVAIDDEDILWREDKPRHLALVDGNKGLLHDLDGQTNVLRRLAANFGPPQAPLSG